MNPKHFINRELSWLEFNQRVLDEAADEQLPLLERLKFLAISGANLDEFFMVRVGGLMLLRESGSRSKDVSGMTPVQQLDAIRKRVGRMIEDQYRLLNEKLMPALAEHGIRQLGMSDLSPTQEEHLKVYFQETIYPVLTPLGFDPDEDEVMVPDLTLAVACELIDEETGEVRYAVVGVPRLLPNFLTLPDASGFQFVTIETLLSHHVGELFPGEEVRSTAVLRITRNGDIVVRDEDAYDLADEMEDILIARRASDTVRLEIGTGASRPLVAMIQKCCRAENAFVYRLSGLLDLKALFQLASLPDFEQLQIEPWPAQQSPLLVAEESMFESIAEQDILLYHPYESFDPVVRFIEEAANDPDVVAIKQILYRTASDSRIIDALVRAAENRKHVTVLVELKARFDEARNLGRAGELRRAGANIIYGVRGLKTHAKVCLVVRNEGGSLRRYCHFGTGNYNEATAKIYTDVSYLTVRPEFGADASAFFNAVTGRSRPVNFFKISAAPHTLKQRLMDLIDSETERALQGQAARIMAKMNSLQDAEIIEALYKASRAGVGIQLNVRGVCCLRPGVKGLSENIEVVSIIDRYLEHARIFLFHQGGRDEVYIASADWMVRNLEKRVELMVPIEDLASRKRLIRVLKDQFADNVKARVMKSDGGYCLRERPRGVKAMRVQEELAKRARQAARNARRDQSTVLEPHVPRD